MNTEKEEELLYDRNALIGKYLTAESAFVANVSHGKLQYFKKTKDSLQPFQLKAVLLEVYIEVLRMLQIPFTEWMRGYCRAHMLKRQETGGFRGLQRSMVQRFQGTYSEDSEDTDNSKYRKVFHIHGDYTVEWRIQKFSVSNAMMDNVVKFSRSQTIQRMKGNSSGQKDESSERDSSSNPSLIPFQRTIPELRIQIIPDST